MATTYTNTSADPARRRYSGVAMLFHWAIATLVIMNWLIADRAHELKGPDGAALFAYHKAWGMLILALTLGRLAWRFTHPVAPLPNYYAGWERMLARTVHVIFYVLLIGLPLGAWYANSLGGKAVDFFGPFTIPALPVGHNKKLSGQIFDFAPHRRDDPDISRWAACLGSPQAYAVRP